MRLLTGMQRHLQTQQADMPPIRECTKEEAMGIGGEVRTLRAMSASEAIRRSQYRLLLSNERSRALPTLPRASPSQVAMPITTKQ